MSFSQENDIISRLIRHPLIICGPCLNGSDLNGARRKSSEHTNKSLQIIGSRKTWNRLRLLTTFLRAISIICSATSMSGKTARLMLMAYKFDAELPDRENLEMWDHDDCRVILTINGRTLVRRLIDEEKSRRLDVKVRWLKLLTPIIVALIGLVGTLTGLVHAIQK